jgi:hypothetical protein
LGNPEALLLAPGEEADRRVGVVGRADRLHHLGQALSIRPGAEAHAPAMTVEAEANEVAGSDREVPIEGMLLGDVAQRGVSP